MAVLVYRSQPQDVRDVLRQANAQAAALKHRWETMYRPQYTTADQPADALLSIVNDMASAITAWNMALSRPGIDEAAQVDRGPGYDFTAEFTALRDAGLVVGEWIVTAWNASVADDYLTLMPNGQSVIKTVTVQQLEGLVTQMDALTALITFIDG